MKKAKWEEKNNKYVCSNCGREALPREYDENNEDDQYVTPFCPFCGCEMYDVSIWDLREELHKPV